MLAQFDLRFAPVRYGSRRLLAFPIKDHKPTAFGYQDVPQTVLGKIDTLLQTYQFTRRVRFLSIRCHPNEATASTVPTFVIETDCANRNAETMCSVIEQVQSILSHLLGDITIEIIDSDWLFDMTTSAIRTTDVEALKIWDSCRRDVISFLRTQEQRGIVGWTSVGLFRRGTSDNRHECPPTILIGSPNADDAFWDVEGRQSILDITSNALSVEIMYSTTWEIGSHDGVDVGMRAYEAPLKMGASIGTAGVKIGGGTLGGFFEFRRAGEEGLKAYGITNSHVAVAEGTEIFEETDLREISTPQTLPEHLKMPTMTSPAEDDHKYKQELLASEHNAYEQGVANARRRLRELENGTREESLADTKESFLMEISEYQSLMKTKQEELELVKKHNISIGTLAAASGARLLEGLEMGDNTLQTSDTRTNRLLPWLMDWAAIELDVNLKFKNVVRDPVHTERTGGAAGSTRLKNVMHANEYVFLDPRISSTEVAFHGRTSGWEFGEVNGLESILNPFFCTRGKANKLTGKYAVSEHKPGYSWAIVPRWGYRAREPCLSGDSGSVVLLDPASASNDGAHAKWVGLLFGHEHGSVAYMTPIEYVIQDIEKVMNGKVLRPARAHGC